MQVHLKENSINELIKIKEVSSYQEQAITSEGYTKWSFDILALNAGTTSLILDISIVTNIKKVGNRPKCVFTYEQDLVIIPNQECQTSVVHYLPELEEITYWDESKIELIKESIAENKIGKALSVFHNHFQKNVTIQTSIILLKAQFNNGKNLHHIGIIQYDIWLRLQTKISYCILQLAFNLPELNDQLISTEFKEITKFIEDSL